MAKAIVAANPEVTPAWKSQPERLRSFLKDVRSEMRKVVSPPRAEVQTTTTVVLVTVFLFAAYCWVVDKGVGRLIETLLHQFTKH